VTIRLAIALVLIAALAAFLLTGELP